VVYRTGLEELLTLKKVVDGRERDRLVIQISQDLTPFIYAGRHRRKLEGIIILKLIAIDSLGDEKAQFFGNFHEASIVSFIRHFLGSFQFFFRRNLPDFAISPINYKIGLETGYIVFAVAAFRGNEVVHGIVFRFSP
jgi:hypothetical protein